MRNRGTRRKITYADITDDGMVRHPSFKALVATILSMSKSGNVHGQHLDYPSPAHLLAAKSDLPNASAVVAGDDAEAIVFDLVQPHLAGGQCLSFGAHKDGERVRLYSRPGNDLTKRLD
jgi:hypothetical protein